MKTHHFSFTSWLCTYHPEISCINIRAWCFFEGTMATSLINSLSPHPGWSGWRLHEGEDPHSGGCVPPVQWGALLGRPETDQAVPRRPAHLHAHGHSVPADQQRFTRRWRDRAAPPGGGVWVLLHNHTDPLSHHPAAPRPAQPARHRLGLHTQTLHRERSVREIPSALHLNYSSHNTHTHTYADTCVQSWYRFKD